MPRQHELRRDDRASVREAAVVQPAEVALAEELEVAAEPGLRQVERRALAFGRLRVEAVEAGEIVLDRDREAVLAAALDEAAEVLLRPPPLRLEVGEGNRVGVGRRDRQPRSCKGRASVKGCGSGARAARSRGPRAPRRAPPSPRAAAMCAPTGTSSRSRPARSRCSRGAAAARRTSRRARSARRGRPRRRAALRAAPPGSGSDRPRPSRARRDTQAGCTRSRSASRGRAATSARSRPPGARGR